MVVDMLIANGANVCIKDKHGSTARTIAEKKGLKEVVERLEAAERAPNRLKDRRTNVYEMPPIVLPKSASPQ